VADVKQRIEAAHDHPIANQKLIYSGKKRRNLLIHVQSFTSPRLGKVLPDDKTIEACEIREKDFLVLMVSKVIQPTLSDTWRFIEVKPAAKSHTNSFHQRYHTSAASSTRPTGPVSSASPTHYR